MKKGLLKSISSSTKMKYTTVGLIFTALVIAIVILLNVLISAFASNHRTYFDMTDEQVYTMSEAFKSLMDENFEKTEAQVEIIFPYDKSEADGTTAISYIHSTAKLLEQRYDNVSISYHDIVKDPQFYRDLMKYGNSSERPTSQTLIIAKKDKNGNFTGEYQAHRMSTFFSGDENGNLYGYDGEYVFASTIIRLTLDENPIVYFTTGHSEKYEYDEDEDGNIKLKGLATIFENIGFSVKLLDRETLAKDGVPEDARSLIIYSPQSDFTNEEMDNINTYFTQKHGHVMCFVSYNLELETLYGNISSITGIEIVADPVNGESNGLIRAEVPTNDATKKYFPSMLTESANRPVMKNAGYLKFSANVADGNEYAFGSGIRTISLLQTNATTLSEGKRETRTLMAISSSTRYENMSDYMYSYMVVCPSETFASEQYLFSNGLYSNRDIIFSILHSTIGLQVPINLDTKAFIQYNVDITEKRAAGMTVLMTLLLPTLVVVGGTAVIIRRKRR